MVNQGTPFQVAPPQQSNLSGMPPYPGQMMQENMVMQPQGGMMQQPMTQQQMYQQQMMMNNQMQTNPNNMQMRSILSNNSTTLGTHDEYVDPREIKSTTKRAITILFWSNLLSFTIGNFFMFKFFDKAVEFVDAIFAIF